MASTNKTTNYQLSQFEGTDKPSWEADYNADMLIIDTNLKAVSDVANGASGDISTLDGRLTTAEGNISTNANDIDALEGRADALEAGQTSDDSRLDALEAEQIVQNTAIESNTRLGYNLARPYDSASTYSVGAYVLFQDTLYKCTTAVSTGEAFDPSKWLAIKATDEIAAGGYTLPTASASTLGGVKVGDNLSIDPVTGALSGLGITITKLDANNFSLSNPTFSAIKYTNGSTSTTAVTLTNPRVEIGTTSTGQQYIAEIGKLRNICIDLLLKFNDVTLEANSTLEVSFTYNDIPQIMGEVDGLAVSYSSLQNTIQRFIHRGGITMLPSTNKIMLNGFHDNLTGTGTTVNLIRLHLNFSYLVK